METHDIPHTRIHFMVFTLSSFRSEMHDLCIISSGQPSAAVTRDFKLHLIFNKTFLWIADRICYSACLD